jgi:hypothetical protein
MKFHLHARKVLARILPLLFFALLLSAYESSGQPALPLNPYQGSWAFTFTGGLDGSGAMEVAAEGNISVHVSIGKYERFFSNPIALTVSEDGALSGDIYLWRIGVGSVEGSFSPSGNVFGRVTTPLFSVGSVSGRFSQTLGAGIYESVAGNGTWSAQKK